MSNLITEANLADQVASNLLHQGTDVRREVPYMSRSIDLVMMDSKGYPLAVEFKLRDWKRGLKQAVFCLTGALKAYICLPSERTSSSMFDLAKENGIGVYGVDAHQTPIEFIELLPAEESSQLWDVGHEWLVEAFKRTPVPGDEDI